MILLHKMKKMLLYGGLSHEEWEKVQPAADNSSRRSLRTYSRIAFLFYAIAFVMSFFTPSMADKRPIYSSSVISAVICYLFDKFIVERHPKTLSFLLCLFEALFLGTAAATSLVTCKADTAVLMPVMFSLIPLLFTGRPLHMVLVQELVNVIYIVGTLTLRPKEIWPLELVNALIFSSVGAIIGTYMTRIKLERHLFEINTRELMELRSRDALTDQLTGLPNRRAFYEDAAKMPTGGELIIGSADINGLKRVNDTYGHQSGDALIRGAADTLAQVFGKDGRVYRTGGDEFQLLMTCGRTRMEVLCKLLTEAEAKWDGGFGEPLRISLGFACRSEHEDPNTDTLTQLADRQMYANKSAWYRASGIDRRQS